MNLQAAQSLMRQERIDGWLVHDFRGSNPVLARLLPGKRWTTRRACLWVPAQGSPVLLHHAIDEPAFAGVGGKDGVAKESYLSWQNLQAWLGRTLTGGGSARVAMEYAPGAALPVVGVVDAGTVELVRSLGAEVVSSANLIQACVAVWSSEAVANHGRASREVARIKDEAFGLIRSRVRAGAAVSEREVQQQILDSFKAAGLETPEPPIVAANEHGGNPHFEVAQEGSATFKKGDWILIDLWARVPGDDNIFSDITWVGYAGDRVPERHMSVFTTVKTARDASLALAQSAWKGSQRVQGWQLDDAARNVILGAGLGPQIRHRTGHSLSAGALVHGVGMNLDNLETHDTRDMLPGIGFTIEPGVYFPEPGGFGVRLEINVYVDPARGPVVTSCIQDEPVLAG
ncbi:MAG: aminopeptidase P family protein [Phycisphaeraceae bacterium]|nr:aminopeptidase P family protein [Phycisphaeraceae bacterium]